MARRPRRSAANRTIEGPPPPKRRWRILGPVWSLLTLAALAGAAVSWLLWMTVPPERQSLSIPALSAPVSIGFDANAVPHIRAASEHDAFVALGFVHARDRMFQMELMRRNAAGRLSEIAGPATLFNDKYMRLLGLGRLAEADLAAQTPETRAALEAYATGVNAWIAKRGRFAAPEFLLLGQPEPWRPSDSLLWGRTMGVWLAGNYRMELARQALSGKIPDADIEALWPRTPRGLGPEAAAGVVRYAEGASTGQDGMAGAAIDPPVNTPVKPGQADDMGGRFDPWSNLPKFPAPFTRPSTASNAWAVDGRFTLSGAPMLAGDPHLEFTFPGLWYLVRIDTPSHALAGATAAGVPFLILGHNESIAWTFTTTGADTEDVFVEPAEARFETREERIKVRGQPDTVLTVRTTRHGPVISDLRIGAGPTLAVAMTALRPDETAPSAILELNHARSVEDAGMAAARFNSPVQNLMVADRSTIGLFVTGRVPIRRHGDGWAPVPGVAASPGRRDPITQEAQPLDEEDDAYGWKGFASGEELPHIVSPASGRLINANEPVAPPNFPVFMGRDTYRDWRARRIRTLLGAGQKFDAADFAAMQIDAISPMAEALLPTLRQVPGAAAVLRDWNGLMAEDLPQPLIFNLWIQNFRDAILAARGIPAGATAPIFDFVPYVLSREGAHWCGGDCSGPLKTAFDRTMSALSERFGPDPAAWRWGAVHRAVFAHPFLRTIPILGALTTLTIPAPGDSTTLDRGNTNDALEAVHGASFRGVYDLADLNRSLFMMTPGQSGNPISRHARDFLTRWRDGAMVLLGPDPAGETAHVELTP